MKKMYLMIVAFFLVMSAFAQTTEIKKGIDDITLDGFEDESVWEAIDPVYIEKDFTGEEPTVGNPYFKAFYTDDYFYLYLNVSEDNEHLPVWVAQATSEQWTYDKPEVYFDVNDVLADGVGAMTAESGHFQFAPDFVEENYDAPYFDEARMGGVVELCYTRIDEGYAVEYKFPVSAFVNVDGVAHTIETLKALPESLGFDITITDRDTDTARNRKVWANDGSGAGESWTSMDDCGTITFSDDLLVGINEYLTTKVNVYPNPASNMININGSFDKVVITNMIGKEVQVSNSSRMVNVTELTKGIYIVNTYKSNVLMGIGRFVKN